jgi:membrane associated rhomboid family serine protease
MLESLKIATFSRLFISIYFLMLIANYLTNGFVSGLIALNSSQIINHYEIWRLFTYIFAPGNIEATILVSFVFWFIGPKLEEGFNKSKFFLMVFLSIVFQGTIFTFLYLRNPGYFTGVESIALLMLSLYVFLELTSDKYKLSYRSFISIPTAILVLIAWFSSVLIHSSIASDSGLTASIISGAFGVILGTVIFMQIKFAQYVFGKKNSMPRHYPIPKPEELIETLSERRRAHQKKMAYFDEEMHNDDVSNEDYYTEERLNIILDKISDYGRESLTHEEELFLHEYSDKL